ncbi:MAG TPA: 50S ribosomal protein L5, partial [Bacilli bacterium]|nr:50S ribosomal protein L5 [Bacilli bacterium]
MNRVQKDYIENVKPKLMKKFGYTSIMQVPKLEKIVVNMGVGDAISNAKLLDAAVDDLTTISGQKPVISKAKKSIA